MFPMIVGDEMKDIVAGMKLSGFNADEPIILLDGDILDGRNRLYSAMEAEVEPVFRDFDPLRDGASAVQFVINKNIHRRHLSPGTRAALAAKIMPMLSAEMKGTPLKVEHEGATDEVESSVIDGGFTTAEGEDNSVAAKAAKLFGASKTNVKLAKKLEEKAPDLFNQVLEGTMTANAAKKAFEAREAERRGEQANAADVLARQHALKSIADTYGEEHQIHIDAAKKKILKKLADIQLFSGLTKVEGLKIAPLLSRKGWDIAKAQKYLAAEITGDTTLQDFIAWAIAKDKKTASFTIDGWKITATSPEAKKEAKKTAKKPKKADSTPPHTPAPQPSTEPASNAPTAESVESEAPPAVEPPEQQESPESEPEPVRVSAEWTCPKCGQMEDDELAVETHVCPEEASEQPPVNPEDESQEIPAAE